MDITEISSNQRVLNRGNGEVDFEDERLRKVARDFEGLFVRQILERMKDTIPESEDEDSSTEQVKGMYWSFLSDAVAEMGGFGLWEQIYESMPKSGVGQVVEGKLNERA